MCIKNVRRRMGLTLNMNTQLTKTTTNGPDFSFGSLLLDNFFKDGVVSFFDLGRKESSYPYDLYENDTDVVLEIPLAGYSKEDVAVEVKNDTLSVNIKKSESKDNSRYFSKKIKKSNLSLSLPLGSSVDNDKITASLKNGLLKISMLKVPPQQAKVIEVQ